MFFIKVEDKGVDVNDTDNHLANPLHFAASKGHSETLEWLLNHGANITLDKFGKSPLNDAAENNHFEVSFNNFLSLFLFFETNSLSTKPNYCFSSALHCFYHIFLILNIKISQVFSIIQKVIQTRSSLLLKVKNFTTKNYFLKHSK